MFSIATKFSPEAANFEKAVFAGYESAELYLTPIRLMSWRSLSKIARSYDMNYVLHFPTSGKVSRQTCEDIVELCRDISCDLVTVHEEDLAVADNISAMDPSIRLAVENQNVSFENLDQWIGSFDHVTLNVDHLWRETLLNCEWKELRSVLIRLLHNHRDRIQNVHVSGYTPEHPARKPIFQSPVVTGGLLDILHEEKYKGTVVCEIDTMLQTSESLKQDLDWFQTWRNQKGIPNLVDQCGFVGSQNQVHESL